jgi:7-cyano-7-deazaguanine reductase
MQQRRRMPVRSLINGENMSTEPSKIIETFPNPNIDRDYEIEISTPEFTCVCPKTGQPDFAEITVNYVPDELCLELKSLKLYYWSYRNEGAFHEAVTNKIMDDLVNACNPRKMTITGNFNVRGGLHTVVKVSYQK